MRRGERQFTAGAVGRGRGVVALEVVVVCGRCEPVRGQGGAAGGQGRQQQGRRGGRRAIATADEAARWAVVGGYDGSREESGGGSRRSGLVPLQRGPKA